MAVWREPRSAPLVGVDSCSSAVSGLSTSVSLTVWIVNVRLVWLGANDSTPVNGPP